VESLPSAKNMDSLQRLAALFELTRAEEEDSFSPAAYDMVGLYKLSEFSCHP
jgi:acyl-CoA-binding protein